MSEGSWHGQAKGKQEPEPSGGAARKATRQAKWAKVQEAHRTVNYVDQNLASARRVYDPGEPVIKAQEADSVKAVETRHKAIKDYQRTP